MLNERSIQRLQTLTNFPAIIAYLRDELDWEIDAENIQEENLDEISYEYTPQELEIDERYAAKVTRIRQLRDLVSGQPWGIFYVEFEQKRLPVTVLRRILAKLVRANSNRRGWNMEDLLFICVQGAVGQRGVAFAHFRKGDGERLPELRTFSWDSRETHFYYLTRLNLEALRWPENTANAQVWREQWRSAFRTQHGEVIADSRKLASEMAKQAQQIRELVEDLYAIENKEGALHRLFDRFQKDLLHDLTPDSFADVIAQTITYGLFSAAEQNAALTFEQVIDFIPNTNPFLKDLLTTLIADTGIDLTELGVDRLVELLREADVPQIAQDFMRQTGSGEEDPVIHFYEQFLNEYDRRQRVERGVFYTPDPVVSYIVRSVDYLLETAFNQKGGLASAERDAQGAHIVQILDPATGTGTFLQYIIQEIAAKQNSNNQRSPAWNRYVVEDLLPRLNGFELMMAPYTIAHMKLGLKLKYTGYDFASTQRLHVYLTNALEIPPSDQKALPGEADPFAREAYDAAEVKREKAIMVVIGNPPYSGHSANDSPWISGLLRGRDQDGSPTANYYEVDGKPLGERNSKWLQDDYVKFIRFGQWRIEKNGKGILAFITNHGYLDNPTFRGMRQALMGTFDDIYIIDLHGNAKRKEIVPGGGKDENVFDIQQGVSIGIFVKHSEVKSPARVHHLHLFGTRITKYETLRSSSIADIELKNSGWRTFAPEPPYYLFIPQDTARLEEYQTGWGIPEILMLNNMGITTGDDDRYVAFDEEELKTQFENTRKIIDVAFRPFDTRSMFYAPDLLARAREDFMQHLRQGHNLALCTLRRPRNQFVGNFYVTNLPTDKCIISTLDNAQIFPLYSYQGSTRELFDTSTYPLSEKGRRPNLNPQFVEDILTRLRRSAPQITFITEGRGDLVNTFGPEDIFHYAYAVFHSPTYRERYVEQLKIDFPRLPLTDDLLLFQKLVQRGADLVALHLLDESYPAASWNMEGEESPLAQPGARFVRGIEGTTVGKFSTNNYDEKAERVYLDSSKRPMGSYFEGIPQDVWEFQIGGYQVLHKWLYDRRAVRENTGRTLTEAEIEHYTRIAAALRETNIVMQEIDTVIKNHGGFPLRGSEDGAPAVSLETKEQDTVTLDQSFVSFVDEDANELPNELNQEMIERGLARASGTEEEPEDPNLHSDVQPFDPSKINIETRTPTIELLMKRIRYYDESDGEQGIRLRPDFQRMGGIWGDDKQSRLIESMMLRIPLPAFYMNEDSERGDELWEVIDGLQRLTTMRRFMLDKKLRLKGMEFWKEYNGKTFDELPLSLRRRLEETQINVYLIKRGTPDNVRFNIFKRINTGGVPLSGQEIRHALNLGVSTDLLKELSESEEFKLATDNGVSALRMADQECVLRFLAFHMRDYREYGSGDDLDTFLNSRMKDINVLGKADPRQIDDLRQHFKTAMRRAYVVFGDRAFRKPTNGRRSPISKALFEVWSVNLGRLTEPQFNTLMEHKPALEGAFSELMDDTEFVIAISYSTGDPRRVKYRFSQIERIIQEALQYA